MIAPGFEDCACSRQPRRRRRPAISSHIISMFMVLFGGASSTRYQQSPLDHPIVVVLGRLAKGFGAFAAVGLGVLHHISPRSPCSLLLRPLVRRPCLLLLEKYPKDAMKFTESRFSQGYIWILILPGVLVNFTATVGSSRPLPLTCGDITTPVTVVSAVALKAARLLPIFYVFLAYELIGCVIILFSHTRRTLRN